MTPRADATWSKPRVLFVSRTRYRLPLGVSLAQKWDALAEELELRVLATAADGAGRDERFELVHAASGASFWLRLPLRIARLLRSFRPDAVVTQSPYEAAATLLARRLTGSRARIVTDVQGDWRTATRLYGSPLRATLRPLADAAAAAALRRVDAVRTISPYTSRLVRELGLEPADEFPAYMDFDSFLQAPPQPLPEQPQALFVGVLERYKNVDGLVAAWRKAAPRIPEARLRIIGDGAALGEAVRRYFGDAALRERLRSAAASSVAAYAPERVFGELEATLRRVANA